MASLTPLLAFEMSYRVSTYLTLSGKKELVELPDGAYGEWIVYQNQLPTYHIRCFDKQSESGKIIAELLSTGEESIESILEKMNTRRGIKLSLEGVPEPRIELKSELKELALKDFPRNWLKDLKNKNGK